MVGQKLRDVVGITPEEAPAGQHVKQEFDDVEMEYAFAFGDDM